MALYSFIILILSGVYLTFWFDPSSAVVAYNGVYQNLRGVEMSKAYESSLNLSFEVRGGLFVRQIHHWAANLFLAAMVTHLCRTFFTGYFLPDDLLSGTGLRITSSIMLAIPVVGSWISWLVFGASSPAPSSSTGSTSSTCCSSRASCWP